MNKEQLELLIRELKLIRAYVANEHIDSARIKLSNVITTLENNYIHTEES